MEVVERVHEGSAKKCSVGGCKSKIYHGKKVHVELSKGKVKAYMCSDKCKDIWQMAG